MFSGGEWYHHILPTAAGIVVGCFASPAAGAATFAILEAATGCDDSGNGSDDSHVTPDAGDGDIHVDGSDADGDGDEVDIEGADADVTDDGGMDCTTGREGMVDWVQVPDPTCHIKDLDRIGSKIYGLCDNTRLIFSANIGSDPMAVATTVSRVVDLPATTTPLMGGAPWNNTPIGIADMGAGLLFTSFITSGEEDRADYYPVGHDRHCTATERSDGCEYIVRDGIKIYDTSRPYGSEAFSSVPIHTIEIGPEGSQIYFTNRQPQSALRFGNRLFVGMENYYDGKHQPGMFNIYMLGATGEIITSSEFEMPPQFTLGRKPGAMAAIDANRMVIANRNAGDVPSHLLSDEPAGGNLAVVRVSSAGDYIVTPIALGSSVILADTADLAVAQSGSVHYAFVADNRSPATLFRANLDDTDAPIVSRAIPGDGIVTSITASSATGRIFVTLDSGYIYSADIETLTTGAATYVCQNPTDSDLHANGRTLYVGCELACGMTTGGALIVAVNTDTLP